MKKKGKLRLTADFQWRAKKKTTTTGGRRKIKEIKDNPNFREGL